MDRRRFLGHALAGGTATALGAAVWPTANHRCPIEDSVGQTAVEVFGPTPSYSIVPVVGDGKWIWNEPPEKDRGYLEPRSYRARIGVEVQGTGDARAIKATTPVPLEHPEQKIDDVEIITDGCQAKLRKLSDGAAQLAMYAGGIREGQTIRAVADFRLTIYKQYHGFDRDAFPSRQEPPRDIRLAALKDSPGIQTSLKQVRDLAEELTKGVEHPWDQANRFKEWVPKNIRARIGPYTSVKAALENRVGDCEERSAVFVALCRSVGIPARLVWVPNHNWSEMYLHDHEGKGHWIPVHTSCYPWFGWVGAHELVLQKGDRVRIPERRGVWRLLDDWAEFIGRKPKVRWTAELLPQAESEGADPGPGARHKDEKGEWLLHGKHPLDRYLRR